MPCLCCIRMYTVVVACTEYASCVLPLIILLSHVCQTEPIPCLFVCLVCFVGAKPSLFDLLRLVVPTIAAKWEKVGQALGVEHAIISTVKHSEQREDGRALEVLALWSQSAAGTGSQPRTWHSLLVAVERGVGPKERERLQAKMQTLSPSPAFDENCQKIVSVCIC